MGIDSSSPVTLRFDFQSESLAVNEEFIDTNGLRGTRARSAERRRQGNRHVSGQLRLQPTALELSYLLPWMFGGSPTGSGVVTYPLADTLPARYVVVDRVSAVFSYANCYVDRATIRGSQGQPMEVTLDIVGVDESVGSSGSFPSLSLDVTTDPFIFTDLSLSLNSTTVNARDFEITWDSSIDKNRFFNSQTLTGVLPMDRHVRLTTHLPYGAYYALYNTGVAGIAGTATFTGQGTSVLTINITNVGLPRHSPTWSAGRQEEMLMLTGDCNKSGSTLETIVSLHT